MKLATDLGGGAAETEKVGELQPDDPKTNRRASRATYVFSESPLSRASPAFKGAIPRGSKGSIAAKRDWVFEPSLETTRAEGQGLCSVGRLPAARPSVGIAAVGRLAV